jgi:hypothetical protein
VAAKHRWWAQEWLISFRAAVPVHQARHPARCDGGEAEPCHPRQHSLAEVPGSPALTVNSSSRAAAAKTSRR